MEIRERGRWESSYDTQFQTEELEYMIWGFILKGKNRTEHVPGIGDEN